jgi:hypothetical protein
MGTHTSLKASMIQVVYNLFVMELERRARVASGRSTVATRTTKELLTSNIRWIEGLEIRQTRLHHRHMNVQIDGRWIDLGHLPWCDR